MKIVIDEDKCTGHGRCYALASELFEPDDYGHGVVLETEPPEGLRRQAKLAESNCPERAITVEP